MKKLFVVLFLAAFAVSFFGTTACKKPAVEDPTPTPTVFALFDNFTTDDNKTDDAEFGGYWYTFDDLAASNDNVTCGNSKITPMSQNAKTKYSYSATVQFVMVAPDTNPPGITSAYCARVSGTVDRSGYPYGFAGFGANVKDNGDATGTLPKITINATALGYTRLQFWYKNGPTLGAGVTVPWKVKLPTAYSFGACSMEEVDDVPVATFTATDTWQKFDVALADFANEGWGTTTCGTRAAATTCVAGAISYVAGGAQYKCTAAQALTMLNAIQWQTNFPNTNALPDNPYDLEIAYVALIK